MKNANTTAHYINIETPVLINEPPPQDESAPQAHPRMSTRRCPPPPPEGCLSRNTAVFSALTSTADALTEMRFPHNLYTLLMLPGNQSFDSLWFSLQLHARGFPIGFRRCVTVLTLCVSLALQDLTAIERNGGGGEREERRETRGAAYLLEDVG